MGEWLHIGPEDNRAYLAMPEGGTGPGVLVLHAWWGLTSVFTDICDRLATEGFVALAPGLYADAATTDSIAEAENLVASNDDAAAEAAVGAGVDELRRLAGVPGAPIAVIGFSLGAYWALHVSQSRPDDIDAVVAVYGTSDGDFGTARSAYLGHFAERDDFEPLEAVRALEDQIRAAGREVTFHVYPGTGHWFAEPNRPDAYDAGAAGLVWERTLAFLHDRMGA